MIKNWAIVKDGKVLNKCVWDGELATWQPPEGCETIELTDRDCNLGDGWDGKQFIAQARTTPPPTVTVELTAEQRAAINALIQQFGVQI